MVSFDGDGLGKKSLWNKRPSSKLKPKTLLVVSGAFMAHLEDQGQYTKEVRVERQKEPTILKKLRQEYN